MYLFAVAFLSAHAELTVFQYLVGNPNEVRLLVAALGLRYFERDHYDPALTYGDANHGR